jgi:hypothetical protein
MNAKGILHNGRLVLLNELRERGAPHYRRLCFSSDGAAASGSAGGSCGSDGGSSVGGSSSWGFSGSGSSGRASSHGSSGGGSCGSGGGSARGGNGSGCDERLQPCQHEALAFVSGYASTSSAAALAPDGQLTLTAARLGLSLWQVQQTLEYVRERAPVIIQINLGLFMSKLVDDTHYRSQFETGTSGGVNNYAIRDGWEVKLFNGAYSFSKATIPFDRCKYGVLNTTGDSTGVKGAKGYGTSYLILRPEVRRRCTFCARDSSTNPPLGTSEHYAHILAEYSDPELRAIVDVACGTGAVRGTSSTSTATYKEVQIHGPVELGRDVETLVVSALDDADPVVRGQKNRFWDKFKITVVTLDDLDCIDSHVADGR